MNKNFELQSTVIEEAGYHSSIFGVSLNKDQSLKKMSKVTEKLAPLDFGHNKFLEHIIIWIDVRAPRYFWQEADTYRLSSKSSQSTMHTILNNKLDCNNFENKDIEGINIEYLNKLLLEKELVLLKHNLPEGFMQRRMWMMSYKTLRNLIIQRRNHRLPHWQKFISNTLSQIKYPELLPKIGD